jgi:hypothetical protein
MLEMAFPFEAAFADMASERRIEREDADAAQQEFLFDLAFRMVDAMGEDVEIAERLITGLSSMEPFTLYPEQTIRIIQRLKDAR